MRSIGAVPSQFLAYVDFIHGADGLPRPVQVQTVQRTTRYVKIIIIPVIGTVAKASGPMTSAVGRTPTTSAIDNAVITSHPIAESAATKALRRANRGAESANDGYNPRIPTIAKKNPGGPKMSSGADVPVTAS